MGWSTGISLLYLLSVIGSSICVKHLAEKYLSDGILGVPDYTMAHAPFYFILIGLEFALGRWVECLGPEAEDRTSNGRLVENRPVDVGAQSLAKICDGLHEGWSSSTLSLSLFQAVW